MNNTPIYKLSLRYLFLLITLSFLPTTISAQDGEELEYIHLRIIEVAPGKSSTFETLIKERSAAEDAAGIGFNHVFQRLRGKINTYLVVSPGTGAVEPDVGLPSSWESSIQSAVASHTVVTLKLGPSISSSGGSNAPPTDYMYSRERHVMSDKADDYARWQERSLLPALTKLGAEDVRTARVVLGGDTRTFVRFSFDDEWPSFEGADSSLAKILDAEDRMVSSKIDRFYRFRDDLSFTASP